MSPIQRNPDTHQPITSNEEYTRAARKLAGLPEWEMDDLGRPFTEEYDPPRQEAVVEPEVPITSQKIGSVATPGFITETEPGLIESLQERADKRAEEAKAKEAQDALRYDPNKEPSEAAKDQGWGPIDARDLPRRTNRKAKKTKPYRGKIRGESEGELRDMVAAQARIDAARNEQQTLDS